MDFDLHKVVDITDTRDNHGIVLVDLGRQLRVERPLLVYVVV